jgi:hypothetical protein
MLRSVQGQPPHWACSLTLVSHCGQGGIAPNSCRLPSTRTQNVWNSRSAYSRMDGHNPLCKLSVLNVPHYPEKPPFYHSRNVGVGYRYPPDTRLLNGLKQRLMFARDRGPPLNVASFLSLHCPTPATWRPQPLSASWKTQSASPRPPFVQGLAVRRE